ncbi:hypothetical protein CEP54_009134 [Fusarium duplospermum]|uniref:Uncharacterized protein n=1 Tax=Fusarium duplospermum TaxID=1325734 RepID=A0A428PSC7_9HYPO|nr:hypothetical protein CEP54_009134 [Fusarium duplospermum]
MFTSQSSDSWVTRGNKQDHMQPKRDESLSDSGGYFRMVRYEDSRTDDNETQLSHSETHQHHGNLPGGMMAQRQGVLGHHDDRHLLRMHNIWYLSPLQAKGQVSPTVKYIYEWVMSQARDLPGITPERINLDALLHNLEESGSSARIKEYFGTLFTPPSSSRILGVKDQTMCYGVVPHRESIEGPRPPTPAMLYGYGLDVFSDAEKQQQTLFEAEATRACLYPFFTIEIQALFNKLERRVHQVTGPFAPELNNVAFSIAMNGTEARLFVTYRMDEGMYGMYKAKSFLLQDPDHHIRFRKCVLNIIEWGQQRLVKIRDALRYLRANDPNEAMRTNANFRFADHGVGEI